MTPFLRQKVQQVGRGTGTTPFPHQNVQEYGALALDSGDGRGTGTTPFPLNKGVPFDDVNSQGTGVIPTTLHLEYGHNQKNGANSPNRQTRYVKRQGTRMAQASMLEQVHCKIKGVNSPQK